MDGSSHAASTSKTLPTAGEWQVRDSRFRVLVVVRRLVGGVVV